MKTLDRWAWASVMVLSGASVAVGCGDDTAGAGGSGGSGGGGAATTTSVSGTTSSGATSATSGSSSSTSGSGGGGGAGGGGEGGSGTGGATVQMEVVATFDPASFEVPEGLALREGQAVVGFALTGVIESLRLDDGAREVIASLPPPPPNTSFMTGVSLAPDGDLVAALVSFTEAAAPGLYRAPAEGGAAVLWASHPSVVFPNGLAWDDEGQLFFTDSVAGGVFVADEAGEVSPWATHPLLGGDPAACGGAEGDIAVGANGIVWTADAVYVAGSDHGVLLRFPIEGAGEAGEAEIVAGPDCALAGIDGLALAADGDLFAAINRADRIVRLDPSSGSTATVAEGAPLDFPASLAFAPDGSLLVTSFALDGILTGTEASPALVRLTLE